MPAILKDIEPTQRGDDLLPHRLAAPHAEGDLQVAVFFGGLDSKNMTENAELHAFIELIELQSIIGHYKTAEVALHFRLQPPPAARKPASIEGSSLFATFQSVEDISNPTG